MDPTKSLTALVPGTEQGCHEKVWDYCSEVLCFFCVGKRWDYDSGQLGT